MNDFKPLSYKELEKAEISRKEPEGWNEELVETAGFVPLEVRMRQMEQAGYVARFKASDFTSDDYRAIWLNPDFEILPGDDLEEVERKTQLRAEFARQISTANAEKASSSDELEETDTSLDKKKTSEEVKE